MRLLCTMFGDSLLLGDCRSSCLCAASVFVPLWCLRFGLLFESFRENYDTAGLVRRTLRVVTASGKCGADWDPRSKLEKKVCLATIFEFGKHLTEPLLPALIRRPPPCTLPPTRTQ
ncbi:hypothetical protein TIFTF001_038889 [Ficus carica]|uniref:Uncharacterized protein n=1 Tax=Ficus carica TaxID=3494 RepID=A0AA88E838_FICCA|nr:hypothetical protein TIFTF001_038889 [Ficus carica]